MWERLKQQNPDFFHAYSIRLKIKEQIITFNDLVNRQAQLMERQGVLMPPNVTGGGSAGTGGMQQGPLTQSQLQQQQQQLAAQQAFLAAGMHRPSIDLSAIPGGAGGLTSPIGAGIQQQQQQLQQRQQQQQQMAAMAAKQGGVARSSSRASNASGSPIMAPQGGAPGAAGAQQLMNQALSMHTGPVQSPMSVSTPGAQSLGPINTGMRRGSTISLPQQQGTQQQQQQGSATTPATPPVFGARPPSATSMPLQFSRPVPNVATAAAAAAMLNAQQQQQRASSAGLESVLAALQANQQQTDALAAAAAGGIFQQPAAIRMNTPSQQQQQQIQQHQQPGTPLSAQPGASAFVAAQRNFAQQQARMVAQQQQQHLQQQQSVQLQQRQQAAINAQAPPQQQQQSAQHVQRPMPQRPGSLLSSQQQQLSQGIAPQVPNVNMMDQLMSLAKNKDLDTVRGIIYNHSLSLTPDQENALMAMLYQDATAGGQGGAMGAGASAALLNFQQHSQSSAPFQQQQQFVQQSAGAGFVANQGMRNGRLPAQQPQQMLQAQQQLQAQSHAINGGINDMMSSLGFDSATLALLQSSGIDPSILNGAVQGPSNASAATQPLGNDLDSLMEMINSLDPEAPK